MQSLTLSTALDSLPELVTLAWEATHCHSPQHPAVGFVVAEHVHEWPPPKGPPGTQCIPCPCCSLQF